MIQLHFLLLGLYSALVIAVPKATPALSPVREKATESSVTSSNTEQKSNGSQRLLMSPVLIERRANAKPPPVFKKKKTDTRSTSSSSEEKQKKSESESANKESLGLTDSSGSSSSSNSRKQKTTKKNKDPVSTVERHGWRKWHRKCYNCPEHMKMKWRDPRIKWICGGYQRARRSFKSACMMRYRNCQDGTMFVKLHDHRCKNDTGMESQPHGEHFMYEYDAKLSEDTSDSGSIDSDDDESDSSDSSSASKD